MTRLPEYFVKAIAAAPDDDAPRLAAADWWEEHGEAERAEFVRVQCEHHRLSPGGPVVHGFGGRWCGCRICGLQRRGRELAFNTVFWGADLPFPSHPDHGRCFWHRGFVLTITCSAADWLAHGDAIRREHPVRRVRLTTWPEMVAYNDPLTESFLANPHRRLTADEMCAAYSRRWPGVEFELPPERGGFLVPPEFTSVIMDELAQHVSFSRTQRFLRYIGTLPARPALP